MTTTETFHANLAIIAKKNAQLAHNLSQVPLIGIQLAPSKQGALTGCLWDLHGQQWVPFHGSEDPIAEAKRDVEKLYTPDSKVFVLLGLGLGYFAVEFAKRMKPYQRMAIFDVDANCYQAAMHANDLSPILTNPKIDTFVGPELSRNMQHWWLTLEAHEKLHLSHPMRAAYTNICEKDKYDTLLERCVEMLRYHAVGMATWNAYGRNIGDNDIGNMPEYYTTPGMQEFKDAWKNRPAVCIAAGPSLTKNLRILADPALRPYVGVITVGTVYALVQSLGIQPDIVTTIDFQPLNWTDQFRNIPLDERASLVYLHSTYPETPRRWPGPKFVGLNASDMVVWIKRYAEEKAPAGQVQTVAHLNLLTALMLGADPIILIGQDLSMPMDAHHAPGARVQDTAVADNPDAHVPAQDIYGGQVWSRHSFLSMRTVFQQIIAANKGRRIFNCTEGGIHIEGAIDRPLEDLLREIKRQNAPTVPILRDVMRNVYQGYTPRVRWDDLLTDFTKLEEDIAAFLQDAKDVQELAREERKLLKLQESEGCLEQVQKRIFAYKEKFENAPMAFAVFMIRCFDLVRMLSEIPQPDGTPQEEQDARTRERIKKLAKTVVAEGPHVQHLLRHTKKRLNDAMLAQTWNGLSLPYENDILRMFARQSFQAASRWVKPEQARLLAQLYRHRHQYRAAAILFDSIGAEKQAGRCYKHLDTSLASGQNFIPQYYNGQDKKTDKIAQDVAQTIQL